MKFNNVTSILVGCGFLSGVLLAAPFSQIANAQTDAGKQPIYVIPDANSPDYPGMEDDKPDGESDPDPETVSEKPQENKTPVFVIPDANNPVYTEMKEEMPDGESDPDPEKASEKTEMKAEEKPMLKAETMDVTSTKGCQVAINKSLKEQPIQFLPGRYRLSADSAREVKGIAEIFNNCKDAKMVVEGHTDSSGNPAANQRLSGQRANSVLNLFVKYGVKKNRMRAVGYGADQPLFPNDSEENKALNRRIELELY